MKKVSDENETQRRFSPVARQRLTNVHSGEVEASTAQVPGVIEENTGMKPKADMIQQLTKKVEKLSSLVELMQQSIQSQKPGQASCSWRSKADKR